MHCHMEERESADDHLAKKMHLEKSHRLRLATRSGTSSISRYRAS